MGAGGLQQGGKKPQHKKVLTKKFCSKTNIVRFFSLNTSGPYEINTSLYCKVTNTNLGIRSSDPSSSTK